MPIVNMATGKMEKARVKHWRPWLAWFEDSPGDDRRVVGETPEEAAEAFCKNFAEPFRDQLVVKVCALDGEGEPGGVLYRVFVEWAPRALTKARFRKAPDGIG